MNDSTEIQRLNDLARTTMLGCKVLVTAGVHSLRCLNEVLEAVRAYTAFSPDNDPYGEHDFGSLRIEDQTVFWKFDYYDLDLTMASPDASDPNVTTRVLTIMLGEEY